MRTLKQLFEKELKEQEADRPSFNELLFKTAFPGDNIKKKGRELTRKSEDIFEPYFEKWTDRVTTAIKERLEADMDPRMIMEAVPPFTRDELSEMIDLLDQYIDAGEDEAKLIFKALELQNYVKEMLTGAGKILNEMYSRFMADKESKKIITTPGIVDLNGNAMTNQ